MPSVEPEIGAARERRLIGGQHGVGGVVVSELFITECAAAAVAPAAIAAIISRPLTALAVSLRCWAARRALMSMMSVAATPSLTSVPLSRYACASRARTPSLVAAPAGTATGTASRSGIRSSVSAMSSSSGAWMTCDSRSNAELSRKSRSSSLPNSLKGMMSVISVASGSSHLLRAFVATPSGDLERTMPRQPEISF